MQSFHPKDKFLSCSSENGLLVIVWQKTRSFETLKRLDKETNLAVKWKPAQQSAKELQGLLAEISSWSPEAPKKQQSHTWGRSRLGFLKKPSQLPNFDQNSENWTFNSLTPLKKERSSRGTGSAMLCPWAEGEQRRYPSKSCPETKEQMRTPMKKREVVSGAFQLSSHTRFHCKRRACAPPQPQRRVEPRPGAGVIGWRRTTFRVI